MSLILYCGGNVTKMPRMARSGADGGPGVTCGVTFDAVYGHRYAVTVARTGTNTWIGTATDTVTGASTHLGTYTLPEGSGAIQGSQGGFVEYYAGVPSCSTMPRADAVFGGPTTTDAGGLSGTTRANYEYSDCVGQANYRAENDGTGTHITRGAGTGSGSPVTSPSTASTVPPPSPRPATPTRTAPSKGGLAPQSTPSPAPTPSVTLSPGQPLARSGSGPDLPLAGAGAALLVGGAGVLWTVRRRRRPRRAAHQ